MMADMNVNQKIVFEKKAEAYSQFGSGKFSRKNTLTGFDDPKLSRLEKLSNGPDSSATRNKVIIASPQNSVFARKNLLKSMTNGYGIDAGGIDFSATLGLKLKNGASIEAEGFYGTINTSPAPIQPSGFGFKSVIPVGIGKGFSIAALLQGADTYLMVKLESPFV